MMENVKKDKPWRPLVGVRIADFSMLLPELLTTTVFADLGAEVVKIEPVHPKTGDGRPLIGVDSQTKRVHAVVVAIANVHDKHPIPQLLHGQEKRVYGGSAYARQNELIT